MKENFSHTVSNNSKRTEQKIVSKLYDNTFSNNEKCMTSVFP